MYRPSLSLFSNRLLSTSGSPSAPHDVLISLPSRLLNILKRKKRLYPQLKLRYKPRRQYQYFSHSETTQMKVAAGGTLGKDATTHLNAKQFPPTNIEWLAKPWDDIVKFQVRSQVTRIFSKVNAIYKNLLYISSHSCSDLFYLPTKCPSAPPLWPPSNILSYSVLSLNNIRRPYLPM